MEKGNSRKLLDKIFFFRVTRTEEINNGISCVYECMLMNVYSGYTIYMYACVRIHIQDKNISRFSMLLKSVVILVV